MHGLTGIFQHLEVYFNLPHYTIDHAKICIIFMLSVLFTTTTTKAAAAGP